MWDLRDYGEYPGLLSGDARRAASVKAAPRLAARHVLAGHSETVEDVVFKPASAHELCSVGDDFQVWGGGLWGAVGGCGGGAGGGV